MHFEMEIINGDVMVLEPPSKNFKIVIHITTGEVLHCAFTDMTIHQFNKHVNHAKVRYQKFLNSKAVKGFMEEE
jgi:hypothetical protein